MRVLLIFVLVNTAVCVEEEGKEKEVSNLNKILSEKICKDYAIEMYNECQSCAEQVATEIQAEKSNEGDFNVMSENNIPKTKEIVTKCYKNFVNSEQFVKCTEVDEEGFISCMESVFPAEVNKKMASFLCTLSGSNECQQCIFDSFKKVWQRHSNKTVKRDAEEDAEEDTEEYAEEYTKEVKKEINELREHEATEITNNCNHFFKNKFAIKKCAKKEFGERMQCAVESMVTHGEWTNPAFDFCYYYIKEESMAHDCDTCVSNAVFSDDVDYHEDDELQKKVYYTKALEKCGKYVEREEEMLECTKIMETDKSIFCIESTFLLIQYTRIAKMRCWKTWKTSKKDECIECVANSMYNAVITFYSQTSAELEDGNYKSLGEIQDREISSNCNQYFQK